jgi:hypothetical protein
MANIQCPNCQQFKFSQTATKGVIGFFLIIAAFLLPILVPAGSEYNGGFGKSTNPSSYISGSIFLAIWGITLIVYSFVFPSKTITYSCSNCKYEKKYLKKK